MNQPNALHSARRVSRKVAAASLVALAIALCAPAGAAAASWTNGAPKASWTNGAPKASWTNGAGSSARTS